VGFGALIVIGVVVYLPSALTANAQTPEEWRAMQHRSGVTTENACLLLALDLTPFPEKKPKRRESETQRQR
jgi:hypothetical protein